MDVSEEKDACFSKREKISGDSSELEKRTFTDLFGFFSINLLVTPMMN